MNDFEPAIAAAQALPVMDDQIRADESRTGMDNRREWIANDRQQRRTIEMTVCEDDLLDRLFAQTGRSTFDLFDEGGHVADVDQSQ